MRPAVADPRPLSREQRRLIAISVRCSTNIVALLTEIGLDQLLRIGGDGSSWIEHRKRIWKGCRCCFNAIKRHWSVHPRSNGSISGQCAMQLAQGTVRPQRQIVTEETSLEGFIE